MSDLSWLLGEDDAVRDGILVVSSLTGSHYQNRYVGGIERCAEQMTIHLATKHTNVALYGLAGETLDKGIEFINVSPFDSNAKKSKTVQADIERLILERNIGYIISNSASMYTIASRLTQKYPFLKVSHIEHMTSEFFGLNRYSHFANMCIAHKAGHKLYMASKSLMNEWILASKKKHDVISRGSLSLDDLANFNTMHGVYKVSNVTDVSVKESNGRAIFIGRASVHKRPDFAAKILSGLNIECDFYLSTNQHDKESSEIVGKMRLLEADGKIKVHTDKPYIEIMNALSQSKFLFCTGLDTFCTVGFEAANYGVPTLFAIKDNLRSGLPMRYDYQCEGNNFIVNTHSKKKAEMQEDILSAINQIKDDMQTRLSIREHVAKSYSLNDCITNIENIMHGIVDN